MSLNHKLPTIGPNKVCMCTLIGLYCGREVKSFIVSTLYGGYSRSYKDDVIWFGDGGHRWMVRFNLTTIIQPQFKFVETCSALN